jgi:pyruvate-formate lyase-activating enzyme
MESGNSMPTDTVKRLISDQLQKNTYKVNFTGGEPLAQHEAVLELAKFVNSLGIKTYLESACYDSARFAKVLQHIDICKIEFKLRDSRAVDEKNYPNLLRNELECLKLAVENNKITYIKVVVTNSSNLEEFRDLVLKIFGIVPVKAIAGFIIQPSHKIDEPSLERLFGFYDAVYPTYGDVRIVPQMHKAIGVR